jgi:hypothetical protein
VRIGQPDQRPIATSVLERSRALLRSVGVIEADLIGEVVGSSSLVTAAEVGVRRVPVPIRGTLT